MPEELSYNDKCERLGNFLEQQWMEHVKKVGRKASQNSWARAINISPTNMSFYINKQRIPEGDNLMRLAMAFGPQVYDVMGIPREPVDDPRLRYIVSNWSNLSHDEQNRVMNTIHRLRLTGEKDASDPTPPLKMA